MAYPLYTLGHSNHSLERFLELLYQHQIEAVGDVRSQPYSPYCPHFNRENLEAALQQQGIRYAFLGRELGARTDDPACYQNGRVLYARLAETPSFQAGLRRVKRAMETRRVALVCAEKDPLTCHRAILIARQMRSETETISHILETGEIETQSEAEHRLLATLGIVFPSLFETESELIERAYDLQGERIAYTLSSHEEPTEGSLG